jgi:hypothetical protein
MTPDWWISPHNYCIALQNYSAGRIACRPRIDA